MTNVRISRQPILELLLTWFQMPQQDNFIRFGIATVTICLPSYLIIFSFASEHWLERYDRWWKRLMAMLFIKTKSEQPQGFWTGLFRTSSQPPLRTRRQSAHDLSGARRGSKVVPQGSLRPSLTRDLTIGSREGSVKFDLPSYGNGATVRSKRSDRTRPAQLEKSPSDPGPLSTLPEEEPTEAGSIRRGLFKSLTERMSGQNSPRSPV